MSIKVMSAVWEHSKQKGGKLLLLLALADYANDEGAAWPSVESLAEKARMSERNAHYALAELAAEDNPEITIEANAGPRGTNLYYVHPGGATVAPRVQEFQGAKSRTGGAKKSGGGAKSDTKGVQPVAPEPSLNPSIEPSIEPSERVAAVAAPPPPPQPPPAVKPAPKPRSRKPTRTPEQHALQEQVVQALEEVTGKPRSVNPSGYQAVGWWLLDSFPDLGETFADVIRERYDEGMSPVDGWQWYSHDFRGMGRKEPPKRPTVFQVRETIYDALQPPPSPGVALTPYTNGHSRDRPASFAGMQIEQSLASIAAVREERLRREAGGT